MSRMLCPRWELLDIRQSSDIWTLTMNLSSYLSSPDLKPPTSPHSPCTLALTSNPQISNLRHLHTHPRAPQLFPQFSRSQISDISTFTMHAPQILPQFSRSPCRAWPQPPRTPRPLPVPSSVISAHRRCLQILAARAMKPRSNLKGNLTEKATQYNTKDFIIHNKCIK